jgi:hypothetical protein
MDNALRISPTLAIGADASPCAPTVSLAEAWGSLAAIVGMVLLVVFSGLGTSAWLVAISV